MEEKLRGEIKDKYKWKLEDYYQSDEEFFQKCEEIKKQIDKLFKYKGSITKSGKNLYEFLEKKNGIEIDVEHLYVYGVYFRYHPDTNKNDGQKAKSTSEDIYKYYLIKTSFVETELLTANLNKLMKEEPKLKKYRYYLELVDRDRPHILSEEGEEILSKANGILGNTESVYECIMYSDVDFGEIEDENGNIIKVTSSNIPLLMRNENREVRKRTFYARSNYFKKLKNTIAYTYKGTVKEAKFLSDVRNFSTPLKMNLFSAQMSEAVYNNLLDVIGNNTEELKKFIEIKRKLLGLDNFHMYDIYLSPKLNVQDTIKYEDAIDKIVKALSVISDEYIIKVKKFLKNNMIDVFPNKGKYSGGYHVGSYQKIPRILYNYTGTFVDFYGLAHEIGHAMHTYYAGQNQPYVYSNYSLILAETASLTNEVLLTNYLISSAKTKDEKIFYLLKHLEQVDNYLYNTILSAEHEKMFYEKELNNDSMTPEEMCNSYYELNKKYYGTNKIIIDEGTEYNWMRYNHYHSPYYFYKYAVGMTAALVIGQNVINNKLGFKEKYIKFLSSGSSNYPLELYKELGIDLENKKTFENALQYYKEKVELLEQLINEK